MNSIEDDIALAKTQEFEQIASELFEVDRNGIALQGFLSVLIASTASIGSHLTAGVGAETALLVFLITFLPNFGLKVLAEYIKKRALVRGMKQGYKKGRKDSLLSDTQELVKWARVYRVLESATFGSALVKVTR